MPELGKKTVIRLSHRLERAALAVWSGRACWRSLIDDQLEFRRLLHWKFARLFTFEEFIDVGSGLPKQGPLIDPIAYQTAGKDGIAILVDRRQFPPCRERNYLVRNAIENWIARNKQRIRALAPDRGKSRFDLVNGSGLDGDDIDAQGFGSILCGV